MRRGAGTERLGGKRTRAGISLVEVLIALTFLVLAAGGFIASLLGGMRISDVSRETAVAQHAARSALEEIQLTDFSDIFASYNDSEADDPDGPGTAPGAGFAVAGLDLQVGDADALAGRVVFPGAPGVPPTVLRENLDDPSFSMPRDLSGDGAVDGANHAQDYTLLPVRVVVEWRSARGGNRQITFESLITERQ